MARLLGFFVVVLIGTSLLARVPIVGAVFRIPFLGFWFTAILVSLAFAKLGAEAVDLRARKSLERGLGAVDTPHHKGKLGSLLLAQGKARRALPLLEEAATRDPASKEWRYRLALARFEARVAPDAVLEPLASLLAEDEEYAFGIPMLLSARARLRAGRPDRALENVHRFEHNHGPTPDSAILRGRLLKAAGQRDEAGAAFDEVAALLRTMPRHAASRAGMPRLRALWARFFG